MNLIEKWLSKRFGEPRLMSNNSEWVINCPFCGEQKGKFYISINSHLCHCFKCGASLHLATLVSRIEKVSFKRVLKEFALEEGIKPISDINALIPKMDEIVYDETFLLDKRCVPLPDDLIKLNPTHCNTFLERDALKYLFSRNITPEQILKYNMSVTANGIYKNRVIIPISDEGKVKFFVARAIYPMYKRKELSPKANWWNWQKSEILFGLDNALQNGKGTVVLCEGIFDALAWTFNGVSMLGKAIYKKQIARLFAVEKHIKKLYICLDYDAQSEVVKLASELAPVYKDRLYIIQIPEADDDPNGYLSSHSLGELYHLLEIAVPYDYMYSLSYKKDLLGKGRGYASSPLISPSAYPTIDNLENELNCL